MLPTRINWNTTDFSGAAETVARGRPLHSRAKGSPPSSPRSRPASDGVRPRRAPRRAHARRCLRTVPGGHSPSVWSATPGPTTSRRDTPPTGRSPSFASPPRRSRIGSRRWRVRRQNRWMVAHRSTRRDPSPVPRAYRTFPAGHQKRIGADNGARSVSRKLLCRSIHARTSREIHPRASRRSS